MHWNVAQDAFATYIYVLDRWLNDWVLGLVKFLLLDVKWRIIILLLC